MGQTLTHGVYLPDEGERNCYNGLAANWQLLDNSVGTIADHTTALAGKAPAVHTHTKSDITDLFNSANTWSASQTFTEDSIFFNYITSKESAAISAGGYGKGIAFRDYQNSRLGYIQPHLTSDNEKRLIIGADSGKVALNSNTIPNANNTYDLGSSSYQWNNVYSKNYFYNGVAWGLDKANVWTANQTISINLPSFTLQDTLGERDKKPANNRQLTLSFTDKNGASYSFINRQHRATTGTHLLQASIENGTYDYRLQFCLYTDGGSDFIPSNNGIINLGATNNKWKSLNGINPGALSLPDNSGYTNISGNITDLTGSVNSYTPPFDGYVMVNVNPNSNNYAYVSLERVTVRSSSETTSGKNAMATIPVIGGKSIDISVIGASIAQARFTPCLGNV